MLNKTKKLYLPNKSNQHKNSINLPFQLNATKSSIILKSSLVEKKIMTLVGFFVQYAAKQILWIEVNGKIPFSALIPFYPWQLIFNSDKIVKPKRKQLQESKALIVLFLSKKTRQKEKYYPLVIRIKGTFQTFLILLVW